jgi:hypothetical protein
MEKENDSNNSTVNKIMNIICIFVLIGVFICTFFIYSIRNTVINLYIDMGFKEIIERGLFFSEIGIFVIGLIVVCIIYRVFSKNIHKSILFLFTLLLNWTCKYYLLCLGLAISNLYTGKFLFDAYGM